MCVPPPPTAKGDDAVQLFKGRRRRQQQLKGAAAAAAAAAGAHSSRSLRTCPTLALSAQAFAAPMLCAFAAGDGLRGGFLLALMASSVAYHCTGRTALRVADVCAVCVVISSHLLLCVQIAAQAERRSPLESPLEAAAFPFGGAASLAGVPPVSAALGAFYALTGAFLMLNFAGSILVPNLLLYAWAFPATATMTYALSRLGLPTLAASLVLTFVGASSFRASLTVMIRDAERGAEHKSREEVLYHVGLHVFGGVSLVLLRMQEAAVRADSGGVDWPGIR